MKPTVLTEELFDARASVWPSPVTASPRSFIWGPSGPRCTSHEPQSRGCHVPGITNYAPRTIIISWIQWAHCVDTVNIWYGKHRRYSQLRCMNKVSCLRRRDREREWERQRGGGEGRRRGYLIFAHKKWEFMKDLKKLLKRTPEQDSSIFRDLYSNI